MLDERLWRDASGRLTFDLSTVTAEHYPALCRNIADTFKLAPAMESSLVGIDQMFWEFCRNDQVISLDWDVWMGFMIVAKTTTAESLVHEIAIWATSELQNLPRQ
ncbi:MAG: hypothetical protein C0483_05695 [Pirellula sp.]|nr:hypothetical protein [Pirellula sp.]